MNRTLNAIKIIQREVETLNEVIDRKINRGLSYKNEARRHKFLVTQLAHLRSQARSEQRADQKVGQRVVRRPVQSSWFGKSLKFASMFLF